MHVCVTGERPEGPLPVTPMVHGLLPEQRFNYGVAAQKSATDLRDRTFLPLTVR